jgi:nucleoside-diphosphate-sugar epimerase
MSNILVTGASGFVGSHVCILARDRHLPVRGAVRNEHASTPADDAVRVGEIDGSTEWGAALDGVGVVIHCAARAHIVRETAADPMRAYQRVNVDGSLRLAHAMIAHGVKRLVFVSSIGVHGNHGHVDHTTPPNPERPYAISKWDAEQRLTELAEQSGLELVIVRPPLVYGAGAPGNIARLQGLIARGLPLPLASIRNQRTLIGVENLADFLLTCAAHPTAPGHTFVIGDQEIVSTPDILHGLARQMGRRALLVPFPVSLLHSAARLFGKQGVVAQLTDSLTVDSSFARAALGWKQPKPSPFAL